jgi:hypothetical protein
MSPRGLAGHNRVPQAILMVRPCWHPAAQPPFFGQRMVRTRRTAWSRRRRASVRASRSAAAPVAAYAVASPLALMRTGRHFEVPYGPTVDMALPGYIGMLLFLGTNLWARAR